MAEEKKNVLQKLKDGLDDKEEQLAIISLFVRLGVVVWSGFIVSLNYIELPGYSNEPKTPETRPAVNAPSILTLPMYPKVIIDKLQVKIKNLIA